MNSSQIRWRDHLPRRSERNGYQRAQQQPQTEAHSCDVQTEGLRTTRASAKNKEGRSGEKESSTGAISQALTRDWKQTLAEDTEEEARI